MVRIRIRDDLKSWFQIRTIVSKIVLERIVLVWCKVHAFSDGRDSHGLMVL
jgi:hypothetical protein